ncbi:DUF2252 domain-containing protein [Geothrix campi]|uniref:DUF2252 domain-containing protein n=1 Tax=Geothrix campi TaxID=2966450 RepID=UPI0021497C2A|nr:DUF2252 domain-containing protein [Geothrix sp. SG10]
MPMPPPRPSLADRRSAGKALRDGLQRTDQGNWKPMGDRPDLVSSLKAANTRRRPDLLPLKWGRMSASPFSFFRGSAALMAGDIAPGPVTGLTVQLCGDAHLLNLGAYAAPDGHLVFDLNDFDESMPGPWEWDLKRLCASVVLGGREAGQAEADCRDAVKALGQTYREDMARFAEMKGLELVRFEVTPQDGKGVLKEVLAKATRDTPDKLMAKATEDDGHGGRRFQLRPPLVQPLQSAELEDLLGSLPDYQETVLPGRRQVLDGYAPVDAAFKVLGTGSIGTTCLLLLCLGQNLEDPLFLKLKSEEPSVWAPYLPEAEPVSHQGRRVALGQHRMQTWVDPFLGWTRFGGRDFLVRQWSDHKAAIDLSSLQGAALIDYAALCGGILAKAHARTGDPAMLDGYLGGAEKMDEAMAAFAKAYADQVTRDHERFKAAIRAGELAAITGL